MIYFISYGRRWGQGEWSSGKGLFMESHLMFSFPLISLVVEGHHTFPSE